jgi:hypothetical protein
MLLLRPMSAQPYDNLHVRRLTDSLAVVAREALVKALLMAASTFQVVDNFDLQECSRRSPTQSPCRLELLSSSPTKLAM